jgi:oligoendopeptidase F
LPISERFYRDLGADLQQLGVLHDLDVRPGKAPLAYTDQVRIGRRKDGRWRPAIPRVSANYQQGGMFVLNELIHEDGHAVHEAAARTRPAFYSLGDDLFVEAFADVPAWSSMEPAWQRKYLGTSASVAASLRELYSDVMLDVAWGLFELRMLRDPSADPNVLWTDITGRYLNIVPHLELSWWALRVQLVRWPGYMINYGLGAVLTADIRQRIAAAIGPFDTGNARWYGWTSAHLLRFGASLETADLLRRFMGRPVSTAALLNQLRRLDQ